MPYTDITFPSAIYDNAKATVLCDDNCKSETIYDGINDCCKSAPSDKEYCDKYRAIANDCTDPVASCPAEWPANWADGTNWNDYLWIQRSCGAPVSPE
jgi:hypothetical protein